MKVAPVFAGGPKATRDIPIPPDFLWKLALVPTKENIMLNRTSLLLAAAVVALGAGAASADPYNQNNYDYSGYSHSRYSDHNSLRNAYNRGYRDGFDRAMRNYQGRRAGYDNGVGIGAQIGEVGVSFNLGDVAFGYQDGYWDRGRHWHNWRNDDEMRSYRNSSGNKYYDWKHDRDPDNGWH